MITLQEVHARLDRKAGEEAMLRGMIQSVISKFERGTRMKWRAATDQTKMFELSNNRRKEDLRVRALNVTVTKVEQWSTDITELDVLTQILEADPTTSGNDWFQVNREQAAKIEAHHGAWQKFVRVTYDCGFAALSDDYADVREALIAQIDFDLRRNRGEKSIMNTQSYAKGTTSYITGANCPLFLEVIEAHKRRVF